MAAGYASGYTPSPTYREVCSSITGHAEVGRVAYDSMKVSFHSLLKTFWENPDPTQGVRQGSDAGTPYRSAIYTSSAAQLDAAKASAERSLAERLRAGYGSVTTEIALVWPCYFAEDERQSYLPKRSDGYCGLGGVGISCSVGLAM